MIPSASPIRSDAEAVLSRNQLTLSQVDRRNLTLARLRGEGS